MTQVLQQLRRIDEVFREQGDVRVDFGWVAPHTDPEGVELDGQWVLEVHTYGRYERTFKVTGQTMLDALAQAAQVVT